MEEHAYSYSGSGSTDTNTGNTYYYMLGGHTLGTWDGTSPGSPTTNFLLTDTLGSVVSSFNNLPNGAATVLGDQVYGPYGNRRVQQGTIGTSKGFTGQFTDFVAGLDYYGARYYDPVVGVFVSADTVQGNAQGMNPYGYVGGNPETFNDPTGHFVVGDWVPSVLQNIEGVAQQNPFLVSLGAFVAPLVVPVLVIPIISIGLALIAGAIYTALTPQNLASGTLPPASPIGFDPPRQNNVDSSPPQTQVGGGGQGNQPPGGGHIAPSPAPGDDGGNGSSPINPPSQSSADTARSILQDLQKINRGNPTNPAATATWETDRGFVRTDSVNRTTTVENKEFGNCAERQCLGVTSKIGASPMMDGSGNSYAQMYEFQINAQMPCSECQTALATASERYGAIRVWGGLLDKAGNMNDLQYMDFVGGEVYGPFIVP